MDTEKMTCPQDQHDSCACTKPVEEEIDVEAIFEEHGGEA